MRCNAKYIGDLDQNQLLPASGGQVVLEHLLTDDSFIRSALRKFSSFTKNCCISLLITIVILTSGVRVDHGSVIPILTRQTSDKRRSKYLEKLIR